MKLWDDDRWYDEHASNTMILIGALVGALLCAAGMLIDGAGFFMFMVGIVAGAVGGAIGGLFLFLTVKYLREIGVFVAALLSLAALVGILWLIWRAFHG